MFLNRLSPRKRMNLKEWLGRIDRVAADLNVLLVIIAVGLATLDATLLVTKQVVDHLPPITRVTFDGAPNSPTAPNSPNIHN